MRITATVTADLSGYVDRVTGHLFFGDAESYDLWNQLGHGPTPARYELNIGSAKQVHWDPRVVETLAGAQQVSITGERHAAVVAAMNSLQQLFEAAAA